MSSYFTLITMLMLVVSPLLIPAAITVVHALGNRHKNRRLPIKPLVCRAECCLPQRDTDAIRPIPYRSSGQHRSLGEVAR